MRFLTIWWKHLSFLVCIQARLFHSNAGTNVPAWCWSSTAAELSLIQGPKGWAQKHEGLPFEGTQTAPSELQLLGKESLSMTLPHFSGSCVTWFLYITKIYAFSPRNLTLPTTHTCLPLITQNCQAYARHTSCNKGYSSHQEVQRFPYLCAVTRKVSVSSCPDKWLVSKITLKSYCAKEK